MTDINHFSKNNTTLINTIFILFIITYVILGQVLLWNIPYSYPFGGPDEPMHLSMANYIANHLSWPQWDSTEVARNAYGVSYSPGGSIVYWLHGLSYKLFGHHRIGAYILLLLYLFLSIIAYRKNRLAGFLLLAGLLPQTLFTFSYINSDTGTIIAALLFGMSVGLFITGENNKRNFFLLLFFAGLTITAKYHLWALAFLTLVWAVIYKRKVLYTYNKKIWLLAIIIGFIPASWWFITSFLANDGDILGIFTSAKAIAKFGTPDLPSLARAWSDFSMSDFIYSTLVSLYANWGWMILSLKSYEYLLVAIVTGLIIITIYKHMDKKLFFFFCMLIAANLGFMVVYSTFYDYQAQGRYLFPSIYIIVGALSAIFITKKIFSKTLLILLILMSMFNVYFSTKLTLFSYVDMFQNKPELSENKSIPYYTHTTSHNIDQFQIISGKLLIIGWLFDNQNYQTFDPLKLVLRNGGKLYTINLDNVTRPDVATVFKHSSLRSSGFSAKMVDLTDLPKGTYDLLFSIIVDGKVMLVDIDKKLQI